MNEPQPSIESTETGDRWTLSEALADMVLRFTSRKFLAAIGGVAILVYSMLNGYIDSGTAIPMILGILAAYGAIEGGPDIVERLRRDE